MKQILIFVSLASCLCCPAMAEDTSTNQVFEPWGSIHSMPERPSLFGMNGYHGPIFISQHTHRAIRGDINFSPDRSRVLVVPEPGPIFSSTNSGMSWTIYNKAGVYQFPVSSGPQGAAMFIEVTLDADVLMRSPLKSSTNNPPNWYAVGIWQNGSRVFVSADASQPAPMLTIERSGTNIIVSWPGNYTGYVLQQNIELNPASWIDMTNAVKVIGEENQVTVLPSINNHFFRLRSQ